MYRVPLMVLCVAASGGVSAAAVEPVQTAWGIQTRIDSGIMCKRRCTPEDLDERRVSKVTVTAVACGSPAEKAGIKVGDLVVTISQRPVYGLLIPEYFALRSGVHVDSVAAVTVGIAKGTAKRPITYLVSITPEVLSQPIVWECGINEGT
jgi:hypothetical protein